MKAEQLPSYAKLHRQRGGRRFIAIAAVIALMVCSFTVGAMAFAREITVEVPVEQETIELKDIGLTLILPDDWKGKYAVEQDERGLEYHIYNPSIREAVGGDNETPLSGGMLFYIMRWDEQLTETQAKDIAGEWNFARNTYIMTTKDGTYLLYYASDVQFTPETEGAYREMESEIGHIRFVVEQAFN